MRFPIGLSGNQQYIYRRQGPFGRLVSRLPAPIKAFLGVTGAAALTVVLAPAIIILAAPPLIIGSWLLFKQRRMMRSFADELHDQRWRDIASFHLSSAPASQTPHKLPTVVRLVVELALESNEQGIATKFGSGPYSFGDLEYLSQEFRMSPTGATEKMNISQYPIYSGNQAGGFVRVISRQPRGPQNPGSDDRVRIEVQPNSGPTIVLKSQNPESNIIIEGHGHQIK